jgi:hypothetical protein
MPDDELEPFVLGDAPSIKEILAEAERRGALARVLSGARQEVAAALGALAAGRQFAVDPTGGFVAELGEALADLGVVALGRWRQSPFQPPLRSEALVQRFALTEQAATSIVALLNWPIGILPDDLHLCTLLDQEVARALWAHLMATGQVYITGAHSA